MTGIATYAPPTPNTTSLGVCPSPLTIPKPQTASSSSSCPLSSLAWWVCHPSPLGVRDTERDTQRQIQRETGQAGSTGRDLHYKHKQYRLFLVYNAKPASPKGVYPISCSLSPSLSQFQSCSTFFSCSACSLASGENVKRNFRSVEIFYSYFLI